MIDSNPSLHFLNKNTNSTHRVNLKNIIQIDQIENLLTSLIHQSEAQEMKIQHLTKLCETFTKQPIFIEQVENINKKLNEITSKLILVDEASTSRINNDIKLPAGELSYLNSIQIEKLSKLIETLATSENVNQSMELLTNRHHKEITVLKETLTPLDMSLKLNDSLNIITNQIQSMNISLQNKMDCTEKTKMEALISRLEMYENFKIMINNEIQTIHSSLTSHDDQLKLHNTCLQEYHKEIESLDKEIKKCGKITEIRSIAQLLQTHTDDLKKCCQIQDFKKVSYELLYSHPHILIIIFIVLLYILFSCKLQ